MAVYGSGAYGFGAYGVGAGFVPPPPTVATALPAIAVEVAFGLDPFASRLVAAFSLAAVTSGQPNYLYVDLSAVADYTIQAGDVLEYDVYWPGASQWVGFDIENATWSLRGATATDQNGLSSHPNTDIGGAANGFWYHRQIPLTASSGVPGGSIASSGEGQTILRFMLAMDKTGTGAVRSGTAYFRDIVITNGGRVVQKIWGQAAAPPTAPSLATVVAAPASGSTLAVTKGAPLEPVVWSNITSDVRGLTIKRGRQHELDRIEAGTMQVALVNDQRQYDRNNTAGPYYPNVLPLRKIRATALWPLNYIANASFETDTSGWSSAVDPSVINAATLSRITSDAVDGAACAQIVCDGSATQQGVEYVTAFLQGGVTYTFSISIKSVSGSAALDFGFTPVGGGTGGYLQRTVTGSWVRYAFTFTPAADGAIKLFVRTSGTTAATFRIDAAQLEAGAAASVFMGSGVLYYLFTGYVEQWPRKRSARRQTLEISCIDGLALFGDVTISKYYAQDSSGNRINQVLDDLGWPTADRVIDLSSGESQIMPQGVISGASPEINGIQHMQDVAEAELGLLFVDGQGRAVFQSRQARIKPPFTISQATFYNDPTLASGNYQYIDLTPSNDSDQIYNYVYTPPASVTIVTDANRLLYLAEDLASQKQFGPRSFDRTPILATSDDGTQQANYLLARYKQPSTRYDDLVFEPRRQAALWPVLLPRELSDRITVVETFLTGSSITSDQHVESITHRIDLGDRKGWQTNLSASPADVQTYWSLAGAGGDAWSSNSILGSTTRLAY